MPLLPLRSALCCALLGACTLLPTGTGHAAPGELDFTFGIGGKVNTDGASRNRSGGSVAVQSDGKILVAGDIDGEDLRFSPVLLRYNVDGALDSGFGTGGRVFHDFGSSFTLFGINSMAVQSDGKIVVAGQVSDASTGNFALVRYHPDGSLDTSFGGTGLVTGPNGAGLSVAVQGDGKILVAGAVSNGITTDFALVRYHTDGSLDTSFGTGGKVTTDFSGSSDRGNSVVVQSDGKILVAGVSNIGSNSDFALVRYTSTGALDPSFGGTGTVTTDFDGSQDLGNDVTVQADGKIVVAGQATVSFGLPSSRFGLARYHANGSLDTSFGGTGRVMSGFFSKGSSGHHRLALQNNGKIVVAGTVDVVEFGRGGFGLIRYHADGTLDAGFGSVGRAMSGPDRGFSTSARDMVLQSDGKVVVLGYSNSRLGNSFALARFYAGEPTPALVPPVFDTETTSAAGTEFRDFRSPAIDGGQVGGLATVAGDAGRSEVAAYAGADGALLVRRGGLDPEGSAFVELGDPAFGGEAVGFAGTARLTPAAALQGWQMDARLGSERLLSVRPGGRLAALYSQLSAISGLRRLAVQTGPAPGTDGQFATFPSFGLPRGRGGLIFTARLHRSGTVTRRNDFGIWRERPAGGLSELLVRIGSRLGGSLAPAGALRARGTDDPRTVEKLSLLGPVTNATDQRRSFAPDGGVAAAADFDDDTEGVVFVAADGSVEVPIDSQTPVPDEGGAPVDGIEFRAFSQPATASGGRFALAAALRAARQGVPAPPGTAVFANRDGTLRRVLARNDPTPGREGMRLSGLGQPLLGERGMVGLVAALTGQRVQPTGRKAIVLVEDRVKAVAARLGEQASGFDEGAVYRRFLSVVVTDSGPARLVFTATVSGPGVRAGSNLGLWSVSPAAGVNLLLRTGQEINAPVEGGTAVLKVRSFDALKAPRKSRGQGRSTDADGFVTAKTALSDGRKGVLRIPLP